MDAQLGLFPDEPARQLPRVGPADVPSRVRAAVERLPRSLRLGTSSWSFPGWSGIVYDRPASQQTLARHGLEAYAAHPLLRTVGIDRTYYRPISAEAFRRYADAVPADFRFVVKADRTLTSPTDPEARLVRGENPRFLDPRHAVREVVRPMIDGLGDKAGPLLFQFSPMSPGAVGGREAFLDRLHGFLRALPSGPLYAIELRTPAFLDDDYVRVLEDTGAAHCYNVHPVMTPLDRQLGRISPFHQPALVMRWMLHDGLDYEAAKRRYEPFDRLVDEDHVSRERIAVAVLDALVAERPAFVIANNKAEGSAPLSIFGLAERIARWSAHSDAATGRDRDASGSPRAS